MADDLTNLCPIFGKPCIEDKCIGYEVHVKQRFLNLKTQKYISYDQLAYFEYMTEEERANAVQRNVTTIKECRQLGKIIAIIESSDHLIPHIS